MAENTAMLEQPLQQYLRGRYPGARVRDFAFLTSGFESAVYTFTLERPAQPDAELILRVYPGAGAAAKLARESAGLARLHQAGYPAPSMLLAEPDPAVLGRPFNVVERLDGSSLWPVLEAAVAEAEPEAANELLERMGALLADLHRLDWHAFTERPAQIEADPALPLRELIAYYRAQYTQLGVANLLAVLDWLAERLPGIQVQPVVVHLDFHANNVFLRRDGRLAVIDWTQIQVSDYRADLAWMLMIMGDYGRPGWAERILESYRRASGRAIPDLPYFQVISDLKLLGSLLIAQKSFPAEDQQVQIVQRLARRVEQRTGVEIA